MVPMEQVKADLREIRYYYSRREQLDDASHSIGPLPIKRILENYNCAIRKAPLRLYDLYACFASKDNTDYSVVIKPYITENTSFTYRLDGEDQTFKGDAETDFSEYFGVVKNEGYFIVFIPYETNMQACLQSVHEGKTVTADESIDMTALPYFAIEVTSYNGESTVRIPFIVYKSTDGIIVDPGEIIV